MSVAVLAALGASTSVLWLVSGPGCPVSGILELSDTSEFFMQGGVREWPHRANSDSITLYVCGGHALRPGLTH